MAILPWSAVTVLTLLISLVAHAQDNRTPDPNNQFIFPGLPGPQSSDDPSVFQNNMNFTVGATISIPWKWTTNMTDYRLVLLQEAPPNEFTGLIMLDCGSHDQFLYWNGNIGVMNLSISNIAYLGMYNCTDPDVHKTPIFFSHYINLIQPRASTTTSSTMTTITTTSLAQVTTSTEALVTSTSTDAALSATLSPKSNAATGSPSKAAFVGAAIGGAIGGALVFVGIGAFCVYRKRSNGRKTEFDGSRTKFPLPILNNKFERQELHSQTRNSQPSIQDQHGLHHQEYRLGQLTPKAELCDTSQRL